MRTFSVVFLFLASFALACAHHRTGVEAPQLSTAPPPAGCTQVGRASGSATEATEPMAMSRARENLASDVERIAGTYVQITGQDVTPVEMAVKVVQVRLEGRVYRCADADRDAGRQAGESIAALVDGSESPCTAPTERRELEAAEGPGWQCGRRLADTWIADGPYVVYWPNGTTKVEGFFENGKRSGRWAFYYANGQAREHATFRGGQLEGCGERFDPEGNPQPDRCASADAGPADGR
jgi:hypothetical protein